MLKSDQQLFNFMTQFYEALYDFAFLFVGMVFGKRWFDDDNIVCKTVGFVCTVSCLVSMLTIVMISINRYIHICLRSSVSSL